MNLVLTLAVVRLLPGNSTVGCRDVAKAWKLGGGGGGGVCAYLPDLKNIFEIYLYI